MGVNLDKLYVVTFARGSIAGPGALNGLRRMPLADARGLRGFAAPMRGRIVNATTLREVA
jgi:hypothetical protein